LAAPTHQDENDIGVDALDRFRAEDNPEARPRKRVTMGLAIEWLAGCLSEGAMPSRQVADEARARGFSAMTVARGRAYLRCASFQRRRQWWVALPETERESPPPAS
jgi:hypothetical protein